MFDVQNDGAHIGIAAEVIEHVAEIHVQHGSDTDEMTKSDALAGRPVKDGQTHGTALGNESDIPGRRHAVQKARVQAGGG